MPAADRCFDIINDRRAEGGAYEDFIAYELVAFCKRLIPLRQDREGRALAGYSMGGYGAVMLAHRHLNHLPIPDTQRFLSGEVFSLPTPPYPER
jgi:pimeloyl-ACP methyl ester carboxylesterase